jgi:hypothetical protein
MQVVELSNHPGDMLNDVSLRRRAVVLTHRRSRLGPSRHPTVHVGTSTEDVLRLVHDAPGDLGERQRAELQRLIRRDHDFHNKTRRPGPPDPAGPTGRHPPTRSR